ncbi:MAG TPA: DUF4389 domain-containing protein [Acidimicrobiales bacterium]|nr:DUF4389 domain-containing protein [Acidimicrobiales bacterium]
MRPARIVLVVAGSLLALVGLAALAAGGALLWAHGTQRDAAGYYNSATDRFQTSGYALTATADFGSRPDGQDWVPGHDIGTVRIRAAGPAGRPLFVGVAPQAQIDRWLAGVAHTRVSSVSAGPFRSESTYIPGSAVPASPAAQSFWAARSSGSGLQTVVWETQPGRWGAVVMYADASPGVAAAVTVGVRTGLFLPVGLGAAGFGLLVLAGSAVMLVLGLHQGGGERETRPAWTPAPVTPTVPGSYPVRLDGHADPGTGRWLWLVKWVLVVPHLVLLAFLWLAVGVLTVVAGFAIFFTERYPRSIFEFNSGVFRWTWRVAFYSVSAFGTDRYPPFSLRPDPTYPAELTIDYPDHLSRWLVLVKWWLLALPQYLVVAILAGGWEYRASGAWRIAGGGGLIGLLALIAAVIRMVRGRTPGPLFDVVIGLNRWCYRVLAYAALMRDEYPPFRLDTGGADPGHAPAAPPPPPPAPPATVPPYPSEASRPAP